MPVSEGNDLVMKGIYVNPCHLVYLSNTCNCKGTL